MGSYWLSMMCSENLADAVPLMPSGLEPESQSVVSCVADRWTEDKVRTPKSLSRRNVQKYANGCESA